MAEEAKITDKDQDPTHNNEEKPTVEKPEKTFTQAELDKVLADRLARERSKMPAPEKLKAFEEWQKSQQTEAEKAAEREKALTEASAKVTALERENAIIKAGVKSEDVDYVLYKVSKLEGDFSKNLGAFLTENKKFTEPETTTVDGMKHKPGGGEQMSGVEAEFLKRNPGLKI